MLVISHWVLDFITHRPDLTLAPGAPKVGMGLWNSVAATVVVEGAIFAAGVWLYATRTRPRNRTGRLAFRSLIAFLVILYFLNMGPPPPNVRAIGVVGLLGWLFLPWTIWIDRNRDPEAGAHADPVHPTSAP